MFKAKFRVEWPEAWAPDPKPVMLQTGTVSRVGCFLFGADYWTWGHVIHTRLTDAVQNFYHHAPIIRHELVHVWQQFILGKWRFLWRYVTGSRKTLEAEAASFEQPTMAYNTVYPKFYLIS